MFHFTRPDFRQLGYGYLLPWEETTKSIISLSTSPRTYPVSRKVSSATMQNYNIIACYPPRQTLYHYVVLVACPSKFYNTLISRLSSVINSRQWALILPHLGRDAMVVNNSIVKAFGAKLDWAAERLSFKYSEITIPAIHTISSKYCSVTAVVARVVY